jgi:hypothetical protein
VSDYPDHATGNPQAFYGACGGIERFGVEGAEALVDEEAVEHRGSGGTLHLLAELPSQCQERSPRHLKYRRCELLEETFRELVAGASARLWGLTKPRYRFDFDWKNDEFLTIDYDNAQQARPARSDDR